MAHQITKWTSKDWLRHLQRKQSRAFILLLFCVVLVQLSHHASARSQLATVNPEVPSTAISALLLSSAGLKSLTDSVTDLKTTVATLVKTMGQVKDSMIPSLTQQVTGIDELVGKVIYDVRVLEEQNVNILGTLEAQD